ncbi:MAG: glutamine amidotransferase [Xanthobacteraceae bacterium]
MTNRRHRRAVALRHVAFEDLGLLAPLLARAGWDVTTFDAASADLDQPAIAGADLLIVLGGPIGVGDVADYPFLAREIALLEARLAGDRPTLGICLGSQLMAAALGARVYAGPAKEIGWAPLRLTAEGAASCLAPLAAPGATVLHWHGDTFDLPAGAVRLASTEAYENQAFAFGKNALALQFHIEADPAGLEEWYVGHTVELAAAKIPIRALRTATAAVAPRLAAQAERVFAGWFDRPA